MAQESESEQTFTPEQVGEIIDTATKLQQLADERSGPGGEVTMSQLGEIARELGIDEQTLMKAMKLEEREVKRSEKTVRRREAWFRRFWSSAIIVGGLAAIDWVGDGTFSWFFYPGIALAMALALRGLRVFRSE